MNESRRLVVIQLSIVTAFVMSLIPISAVVLAENALHPAVLPIEEPGSAIAASRDVQVIASDGAVLRAWLFLPENKHSDFVIAMHGVGDNRAGIHRLIQLLLKNGYGVLAPDSRAQGESTGGIVTYGAREAGDVHLWADYLYRTERVDNLYGLGESMGAAVLLQSLPLERRFRAVVAECPFSSFDAIAKERIQQILGGTFQLTAPIAWTGLAYVRLRYGVDLRKASPIEAVRHTETPVLLIHGLRDRNISPQHSRYLLMANPRRIVPWFVPKAGHIGAYGAGPEVFEERVMSFYRMHAN
jgi:dipeptidyl aminopeptidase/acylaminoacyl peptidase